MCLTCSKPRNLGGNCRFCGAGQYCKPCVRRHVRQEHPEAHRKASGQAYINAHERNSSRARDAKLKKQKDAFRIADAVKKGALRDER